MGLLCRAIGYYHTLKYSLTIYIESFKYIYLQNLAFIAKKKRRKEKEKVIHLNLHLCPSFMNFCSSVVRAITLGILLGFQ